MVTMVMTTCNYNCRHNYDYIIWIGQCKKTLLCNFLSNELPMSKDIFIVDV